MRKLRDLSRLKELSRRIVRAWEEAYAGAKQDPHRTLPLVHKFETIELPRREVTQGEVSETRIDIEKYSQDPANRRRVIWLQEVLDRHERQEAGTVEPFLVELHVIRPGDIDIATNPFELITEFGIQMKSRSPTLQTFVIQLVRAGTYDPTAEAVRGGGYSSITASNEVGPEGGQLLTEKTINPITRLWSSTE